MNKIDLGDGLLVTFADSEDPELVADLKSAHTVLEGEGSEKTGEAAARRVEETLRAARYPRLRIFTESGPRWLVYRDPEGSRPSERARPG